MTKSKDMFASMQNARVALIESGPGVAADYACAVGEARDAANFNIADFCMFLTNFQKTIGDFGIKSLEIANEIDNTTCQAYELVSDEKKFSENARCAVKGKVGEYSIAVQASNVMYHKHTGTYQRDVLPHLDKLGAGNELAQLVKKAFGDFSEKYSNLKLDAKLDELREAIGILDQFSQVQNNKKNGDAPKQGCCTII